MLLPDPFLPGLKVDRLPETAHAPQIWADLEIVLANGKVLSHVHNYIYSVNTAMIAKIAKALVKIKDNSEETAPDRTLLNTLVLHCGVQAMGATSTGPPIFEVSSPWVSLLHELFKYLGPIGESLLLAIEINDTNLVRPIPHAWSHCKSITLSKQSYLLLQLCSSATFQ